MATQLAKKEEASSEINENLDDWEFPKIPVDQVYNTYLELPTVYSFWSKVRKMLKISSYTVKEYEETIALKASNQSVSLNLLSRKVLKSFVKKRHEFVHLGLVQIAIKPLLRDGLGAPIIACLRDDRCLYFETSVLALVESDISQGAFYFNYYPGYSVPSEEISSRGILTLNVLTSGVPLALTYRLVCKATQGITIEFQGKQNPKSRETTYFQPSDGTTQSTTKWDEVQIPESWTRNLEP